MKRKQVVCGAAAAMALCLALGLSLGRGEREYSLELASEAGGAIPIGIARVLNGSYAPGTKIRLAANSDRGYNFARWSSSGGGEFDDPARDDAVFIMPESDVTLTAHFEVK